MWRRKLLFSGGILQHVGPLAASSGTRVLEMLVEVIRSIELFGSYRIDRICECRSSVPGNLVKESKNLLHKRDT